MLRFLMFGCPCLARQCSELSETLFSDNLEGVIFQRVYCKMYKKTTERCGALVVDPG